MFTLLFVIDVLAVCTFIVLIIAVKATEPYPHLYDAPVDHYLVVLHRSNHDGTGTMTAIAHAPTKEQAVIIMKRYEATAKANLNGFFDVVEPITYNTVF